MEVLGRNGVQLTMDPHPGAKTVDFRKDDAAGAKRKGKHSHKPKRKKHRTPAHPHQAPRPSGYVAAGMR